jgi:hypothetical protein
MTKQNLHAETSPKRGRTGKGVLSHFGNRAWRVGLAQNAVPGLTDGENRGSYGAGNNVWMHDDTSGKALDCSGVRSGDGRPVVTIFRYARDGLFLFCCSLYALNRWVVKPHVHAGFFRNYFNDVLLIPCALPLVLLVQRRFGLRRHDLPPSWSETLLHLAVWAFVCEWLGPRLFSRATADPWDAAAYSVGALLAWSWWNRPRSLKTREPAAA